MFSQEQIDKLGNAIVYLSDNINKISKTKLLKLIYILDEISIKKSGIPFFNLNYKVWKFGPVSSELFVEFSSSPSFLKSFFERKNDLDGHSYIVSLKKFEDDEFTENEIKLLEFVTNHFKGSTTEDLISYTHRENSPWYNAAKNNSVLEDLTKENINTTDFEVNMKELVEYDSRKTSIYENYLETCN